MNAISVRSVLSPNSCETPPTMFHEEGLPAISTRRRGGTLIKSAGWLAGWGWWPRIGVVGGAVGSARHPFDSAVSFYRKLKSPGRHENNFARISFARSTIFVLIRAHVANYHSLTSVISNWESSGRGRDAAHPLWSFRGMIRPILSHFSSLIVSNGFLLPSFILFYWLKRVVLGVWRCFYGGEGNYFENLIENLYYYRVSNIEVNN